MPGRVAVENVLDIKTPHTRMGHNAPVRGNFQEQKFHFVDHFDEYTDAKFWTANVGNGGNVPAVIVGANGVINIITNATAEDVTELGGTTAMLYAAQGITIEARFKAALVTNVLLCFGVVNAVSATNDKIAFNLASDTITAETNIADAACFVYDTGATTKNWWAVSVKASGTPQGAVGIQTATPVNAVFEVFRINLDTSGNATFWRNGLIEGVIASAVTTTNSLIPYLGVRTHTTAARSLTPDRVEIWQGILESATVLW